MRNEIINTAYEWSLYFEAQEDIADNIPEQHPDYIDDDLIAEAPIEFLEFMDEYLSSPQHQERIKNLCKQIEKKFRQSEERLKSNPTDSYLNKHWATEVNKELEQDKVKSQEQQEAELKPLTKTAIAEAVQAGHAIEFEILPEKPKEIPLYKQMADEIRDEIEEERAKAEQAKLKQEATEAPPTQASSEPRIEAKTQPQPIETKTQPAEAVPQRQVKQPVPVAKPKNFNEPSKETQDADDKIEIIKRRTEAEWNSKEKNLIFPKDKKTGLPLANPADASHDMGQLNLWIEKFKDNLQWETLKSFCKRSMKAVAKNATLEKTEYGIRPYYIQETIINGKIKKKWKLVEDFQGPYTETEIEQHQKRFPFTMWELYLKNKEGRVEAPLQDLIDKTSKMLPDEIEGQTEEEYQNEVKEHLPIIRDFVAKEVDTMEVQKFLVPGLLIDMEFNLLGGDTGIGKTRTIISILSEVLKRLKAKGVILSIENDTTTVLAPLIKKYKAKEHLLVIEKENLEPERGLKDQDKEDHFVKCVEEILKQNKGIKVLLLDPLPDWLNWNFEDSTFIVEKLRKLALKYKCAIIGIRNDGKDQEHKVTHKVKGSSAAFADRPRMILRAIQADKNSYLGKKNKGADTVVIYCIKSSRSEKAGWVFKKVVEKNYNEQKGLDVAYFEQTDELNQDELKRVDFMCEEKSGRKLPYLIEEFLKEDRERKKSRDEIYAKFPFVKQNTIRKNLERMENRGVIERHDEDFGYYERDKDDPEKEPIKVKDVRYSIVKKSQQTKQDKKHIKELKKEIQELKKEETEPYKEETEPYKEGFY